MPSLNKVFIMGHLGADPELKYTANDKAVCNFNVATSYGSGDNKKTEWFKVVVWEKTAEYIKEYCRKGSLVFVEGRLQTRSWGKDGDAQYITEVIAFSAIKLDRDDQSELPLDKKEDQWDF